MCRALIVKAIEVTQVRYKPYETIERTDFFKGPSFWQFGSNWKLLNVTSIWRTKTMLNVSFKFMYLLMPLLMLLPAQHWLPLYWPLKRAKRNSECLSNIAYAVPKQYQFKKYKNCFVLMQLHLMLKIVVCDAWLALWIFVEKFCSKIFWITLEDVNSLLNNVSSINIP